MELYDQGSTKSDECKLGSLILTNVSDQIHWETIRLHLSESKMPDVNVNLADLKFYRVATL